MGDNTDSACEPQGTLATGLYEAPTLSHKVNIPQMKTSPCPPLGKWHLSLRLPGGPGRGWVETVC